MASSQPHLVNTDSTGNSKVLGASLQRTRVGKLLLPSKQTVSLNSELTHGLTIFPSSGTNSWGSYFTIDIRTPNIMIHNITLQWNLGAVTGASPVGYFSPSFYFATRIEVVQGGQVISTLTGNEMFLKNQLCEWTEDLGAINNAAGNYASTAQRTLLSSTSTTNTFYTNLRTYFDEIGGVPVYNDQQGIQLRIYTDILSNVFKLTSGTLTSCAINSVNAICKTTKLDAVSSRNQLSLMSQYPFHSIFHDNLLFSYSVPSGVATSTTILAGITGKVAALYFTVRASTVTDQAWVYSQIASFAINDNTGTSLVGGQVVPASFAANLLNKECCKSQYFSETSFGIAANDTKANFYCWSFSPNIIGAISDGLCIGSRVFTGQESLQINFTSALGATVQVDCYALTESVLEMTSSSIRKIAM